MQQKKYIKQLFVCVLLSIFIFQCSKNSKPEIIISKKQSGLMEQGNEEKKLEQVESIPVLDKIPKRIQEVENLTIFEGELDPLYSVELIKVQTFGHAEETFLTQIITCMEDNMGRVIIWGTSLNYEQFIYVYNANGTYHSQLGRQGKGPGEYVHIVGIESNADKLMVLDYTSKRVNEYSITDYSFLRSILFETWEIDEGLSFGYVEGRNDGNYLVSFIENGSVLGRLEVKYQVLDANGTRIQANSLSFPAGFSIKVDHSIAPVMPLTFYGTTITALTNEDVLYVINTRDFLIKKYDANGVYQSAFYYPIEGSPFDLNEYTSSQPFSPKPLDIEKALIAMDEDFPETFPVLNNLIVDDENRIWVELSRGGLNNKYEWWILKESGELLAKLLLPRDQPLYDIKNGYLYSKNADEENGTEYIIKYRIEFTQM